MRSIDHSALARTVRLSIVLTTVIGLTGAACADPLNPLDYVPPTGGVSMALLPGTYTINTDTLAIISSGGGSIAVGVLSPDNAVAVFAFQALNVPAGTTITIVGRRPCAILAATNLVITGTINLSGGNGADWELSNSGAGGIGRAGGGFGGAGAYPIILGGSVGIAGAGMGGGAGGVINATTGIGGSFGTAVGNGLAYGNLVYRLEGGSGGGGSAGQGGGPDGAPGYGGGGGAGGGAIELGAIGSLTLTGASIVANGGNGGAGMGPINDWGGGGSGGAVLLHAADVSLPLSTQVQGGRRGASGAVTGGAGRVVVQSVNNPGTSGINGGTLNSYRTGLVTWNVDFGDVPVNTSKILPVLIQNQGPFPSTINGRFPDAAAGGPFTRMGDSAIFTCVRGGAGFGLPYRFAPTSTGTFTQTLTFLSDGGNATVTITGRGVLPPEAPHCVADLGIAGGLPGHDGFLDNNDFIVFITDFFNQTGCP